MSFRERVLVARGARHVARLWALTALLAVSRLARAEQPVDRVGLEPLEREARSRHLATDIPLVAYTTNAFGADAMTLGASGFGESRLSPSSKQAFANGGLRVWGSPIERIVLMLDAQQREENDQFAPTLTGQVRLLGSTRAGYALSLLARYKTVGFADLEGEAEGGVLLSVVRAGFHLDTNAIAGGDFDGGEGDAELLARAGYDLLPFLFVGVEARGRYRLFGTHQLPGHRSYDAFGGAQAVAFAGHYFAALTAGPSTVGIVDDLGWSAILNAGGVAF
jgi:hypothetical protein